MKMGFYLTFWIWILCVFVRIEPISSLWWPEIISDITYAGDHSSKIWFLTTRWRQFHFFYQINPNLNLHRSTKFRQFWPIIVEVRFHPGISRHKWILRFSWWENQITSFQDREPNKNESEIKSKIFSISF